MPIQYNLCIIVHNSKINNDLKKIIFHHHSKKDTGEYIQPWSQVCFCFLEYHIYMDICETEETNKQNKPPKY